MSAPSPINIVAALVVLGAMAAVPASAQSPTAG
ncbi:MAG: hypothetical protein JWN53_205, partial [Gemmatimonadetes bacterium]|nr:hypothetical protein [Gemmatimonadota bacterium]